MEGPEQRIIIEKGGAAGDGNATRNARPTIHVLMALSSFR